MLEAKGKYTTAKIFTDQIEDKAYNQILEMCNEEFMKDSKVRIMPDVHAGRGCTIGTTITLKDKVCPNLVGVDIGCGVLVTKIEEKEIDFQKLDNFIRRNIPIGMGIRREAHNIAQLIKESLNTLKCKDYVNVDRALKSIGTLGGGNHFFEVNKDSQGFLYLVIHSGSRNLGKQVAEYYQDLAISKLTNTTKKKVEVIDRLMAEGREQDIQAELKKLGNARINKELAYLQGEDFKDYIHDMAIIQKYANLNREAMAEEIINNMGWKVIEQFKTIHNYIDTENMILRKGAVSAQKDEKLIIPLNMRDGSIICVGKGNEDWNYSAPHGAGRLMSRTQAKKEVNLEEYKKSMKGVWSSSISKGTIDESPMAYKSMESIVEHIGDTADILEIIKPVYNFKASE